jgi:hypothetical protein
MDKIRSIVKESELRQAARDQGEGDYLRSLILRKPGEVAVGRFCEDGSDLWAVYVHRLPKAPGQAFGRMVLCPDQPLTVAENGGYQQGSRPCYACELATVGRSVGRSVRYVGNFIRYDDPDLIRDADGKALKDAAGNYQPKRHPDGSVVVKPTLLVYNFPQVAGNRLVYLQDEHGPLSNHVCKIVKQAEKLNPFMVDVSKRDELPPEPWEKALFDAKVEPPVAVQRLGRSSLALLSYGDMKAAYSGVSAAAGIVVPGVPGQQPQSENPYAQAAQGVRINRGAFS